MATRRSNFHGQDFVPYSPELFANAVEIAGVQIVEVPDGRVAATYVDEVGERRMSVTGRLSALGLIYRTMKAQRQEQL